MYKSEMQENTNREQDSKDKVTQKASVYGCGLVQRLQKRSSGPTDKYLTTRFFLFVFFFSFKDLPAHYCIKIVI